MQAPATLHPKPQCLHTCYLTGRWRRKGSRQRKWQFQEECFGFSKLLSSQVLPFIWSRACIEDFVSNETVSLSVPPFCLYVCGCRMPWHQKPSFMSRPLLPLSTDSVELKTPGPFEKLMKQMGMDPVAVLQPASYCCKWFVVTTLVQHAPKP